VRNRKFAISNGFTNEAAFDLHQSVEKLYNCVLLVHDIERDAPRGLNVQTLLEICSDDLPGMRDRKLQYVAYDPGLRTSELVAVEFSHIIDAIDPESLLLTIAQQG